MAEKYHISPSTGNPNRCYAKKSCPLGASDAEHYASKAEAREAFEKAQETIAKPVKKKVATPKKEFSPEELQESVADYRASETSAEERENIAQYWSNRGAGEQFAAALEKTAPAPVDEKLYEDWQALGEWDGESKVASEVEVSLDDDFSDIKCEDCGRPLDKCICGECEYCGVYPEEDHEEDCPLHKPKPRSYSWDD